MRRVAALDRLRALGSALRAARHPGRTVSGKLMAIVLLTTGTALVVAGIAMTSRDLSDYRHAWAADLATEADMLAISTGPALAFDDFGSAQRNLAALAANRSVLVAAAYTPAGHRYAQFARHPADAAPLELTLPPGVRLSGERIELVQPIRQRGEFLGTIYLRARYDVLGRVENYLGIFALVMCMSLGVALVLSTSLQRSIAEPLEAMAAVARHVVDRRDYSRRVHRSTGDEITLVIDAFNTMLDEIQARSRALEDSQEALRETDRRKDEFLATLAHELRNPLAPIRHAVRLLESPATDDARRVWARAVIARQAHRMALLLDDLLDVSRITRGRLDLRRERVELQSLVASAVETARPLIEAKRHDLELHLPAARLELDVDPLRMSQALSNLLTNAAKYTDAGGRIRLAVELQADNLAVSVTDSGIGLTDQSRSQVFEMFSQIESAIDRAEGGLGIGLSLVKGLVALHGGSVEATSAGLGRGSTFTIRLPAAAVEAREAPAAEPDLAPKRRGRGCKLLVADDNRDAAESLALVLQLAGHQTLIAHAGREALDLGRRERPQAFILDIGMPDMTGYEVARRIRLEAWGRGALLLAVTGWGQRDDKDRARAAGFDDHLTKPVDPDVVESLLEAFLSREGELMRPMSSS
jgi:signal transduction histidine kinase/CheY-like chemotaxis protein